MNIEGLERRIDGVLRVQSAADPSNHLTKYADSILGRRETLGGTLAQTGLYMIPILGSGLSIADGVNDLWHGRWKSGLGNLALGIGSGIADFFSLGTAGTALRGTAVAARGARAAIAAGNFVGSMGAQGADLAARGLRYVAGPKGYAGVINAGRGLTAASRSAQATVNGWKGAVRGSVGGFVKQSPALSWAYRTGKNVAGRWNKVTPWIRYPVNFAGSMAAYSFIPGADIYANARLGNSILGRSIWRGLLADGGTMIPKSMQGGGGQEDDADMGPDNQAWRGGYRAGRAIGSGMPGFGGEMTLDDSVTRGWERVMQRYPGMAGVDTGSSQRPVFNRYSSMYE